MRRRFYVEQFEGDRASLRDEAAHHLSRVLRAEPGQLYELSDGNSVRLGCIERATRDLIEFTLHEIIPSRAPRLTTTLLLSIVKFDRFEWALEKATELGASSIVPLSASRSERALVAAAEKRAERWGRILMESAQQARRLRPPVLQPVADVSQTFTKATRGVKQHSGPLIILSELPDAPAMHGVLGKFSRESTNDAALAIGPEGGWTEDEFKAAAAAGFSQASLGSNILRTETAVTAALAIFNFQFE